jgi:hypothetical protein
MLGAWLAAVAFAFALGAGCSSSSPSGDDTSTGGTGGGATGGTGGAGGTGASGGTSGTQGLGGSGGSGGTGGTTTKPPAAVGFGITLSASAVTDNQGNPVGTCHVGPTGATSYSIGVPAAGYTIPDGTGGVSVSCYVGLNSDATTMNVAGNVSGPDAATSQAISLVVTSPMIQSRDGAPANIAFSSDSMGALTPIDSNYPCTLGPFGTLKNGAMLADFTCPLLGSPTDATVACNAHGTLALEYCDTGG